jgi:hypothetical protein
MRQSIPRVIVDPGRNCTCLAARSLVAYCCIEEGVSISVTTFNKAETSVHDKKTVPREGSLIKWRYGRVRK